MHRCCHAMQATLRSALHACRRWLSTPGEKASGRWLAARAGYTCTCLVIALAQPNVPRSPAGHWKMVGSGRRSPALVMGDNPDQVPPASVASIHGMSKLLTFRFDEGRPRLSPAEEAKIRGQVLLSDPRQLLRSPATTLIAVGYVDHAADPHRSRQVAFRRAQIIVDLLRDLCGTEAAVQVVTQPVKGLPVGERAGRERVVEIWFTTP